MKSYQRAIRRHHRRRMIRHACRTYTLRWELDTPDGWQRVLQTFNHLKVCSCWMCGNPRRYTGELPYQERRLHEAARFELHYHRLDAPHSPYATPTRETATQDNAVPVSSPRPTPCAGLIRATVPQLPSDSRPDFGESRPSTAAHPFS